MSIRGNSFHSKNIHMLPLFLCLLLVKNYIVDALSAPTLGNRGGSNESRRTRGRGRGRGRVCGGDGGRRSRRQEVVDGTKSVVQGDQTPDSTATKWRRSALAFVNFMLLSAINDNDDWNVTFILRLTHELRHQFSDAAKKKKWTREMTGTGCLDQSVL